MTLDSLVLHPRTKKDAERIARRLPHALIINGPSGVGVTELAKAIARENRSPEFTILPKKKIKNEFVVDMNDGNIVIEDIRDLYAQTRTKQPGKHVYILDTGEKTITPSAQNAFLKLLEEPRSDVHFIIATHHPDQLLPTITSRCQRLQLLPVTDEQTTYLVKELGVNDETKVKRLAFVGRGRPALLKRLANSEEEYNARVQIMTDAKVLLSGSLYEKLSIVQKYRDNRPDCLTLLEDAVYQLHTVIKSSQNRSLIKSIEMYLQAHDNIAVGGNIRLQLTSAVL